MSQTDTVPTPVLALSAQNPASEEKRLHLLLELDAAAAETFRRDAAPLLQPERRPVTRHLRQVFWDTAQQRIFALGFACGTQTVGQRRLQIMREIRHRPAGGRLLLERTGSLAGEALDITRLAFLPGVDASAVADLANDMLLPLFGIDLVRTTWKLTLGDSRIEATLDRALIETPSGNAETAQLDLAAIGGPPEELYRLARRLAGALPFRLAESDTIQRGYALATGHPAWPSEGDVALTPEITVRQGVLAIGRVAVAAVRDAVGMLEVDLRPEPIHRARVAMRRLRSMLSLFKSVLPPVSSHQFGRALSELAKLLADARDWDVWLAGTIEPLHAALDERDPILDALTGSAQAERLLAAQAIADAVRSREFVLLSLGLGAWFDAGIWPEPAREEEMALLESPLLDFARKVLKKRHRKLVKTAENVADAGPDQLHALRIESKRLRYAAEFLRPLFPAKQVRRYLTALKSIQDILGTANDAVVARRLIPQLADADPPTAARVAGLITGWTAAEATNARCRFVEAWREFMAAKRFWKP